MKLKIAYIYPKLLNNYGNNGNILTLKKRCEWRNIPVEINEINPEDKISSHDLYYIGDGDGTPLIKACRELIKQKDFFINERDKMAVILGVGGGYKIMGNYFEQEDGHYTGLGILDIHSKKGKKRHTGNVTIETEYITPNSLVGFENSNWETFLDNDTTSIGKVIIGHGNNGTDTTEGARNKNTFGTNLSGPFLPKNVVFTDYLIELALGSKLEPIKDDIETTTHNSLIQAKY